MTSTADTAKLSVEARRFATDIKDLLNKTVCTGASVQAKVTRDDDKDIVVVGTNLDGLIARPVPLKISRKKPRCWIEAQFRCDRDDRGYFRVLVSAFFIYADEGETELCHYDYERNKEGYPAAHLQIAGMCPALDKLPPDKRKATDLKKLHFPVGGRRYRPTIEDMIEFVITEGIADGRDDWDTVVEQHRNRFTERQLRAAIRRNPQIAREVLATMEEA